jgi:cytochrome c oxidase subunit IV
MSSTSSTTSAASTTETPSDSVDHGTAHHPSPREYVRIAVVLGVLTALEVSTYFVDFGRVAIPLLVVLMTIKFVLVAGFFMHLRFDTKLYGRMLYGGLALALGLYAITLVILYFERAPTV